MAVENWYRLEGYSEEAITVILITHNTGLFLPSGGTFFINGDTLTFTWSGGNTFSGTRK